MKGIFGANSNELNLQRMPEQMKMQTSTQKKEKGKSQYQKAVRQDLELESKTYIWGEKTKSTYVHVKGGNLTKQLQPLPSTEYFHLYSFVVLCPNITFSYN